MNIVSKSQYWFVWLSAIISFVLLLMFHDAGWSNRDDGVFATLAQQILNGGVFGIDVIDFHGGYHHFVNALMFKWFGLDMVVMRYPLILIGTAQAALVSYLLRSRGKLISVVTGVASVGMGYLLIPAPSPNWYTLFFAIVVVAILTEFGRSRNTLIAVGLVVGLCFMFRHPSAIFLGMGVMAYLLQSSNRVPTDGSTIFQKGLLLLLGFAVLTYSSLVFEPFAFLLFAAPPLLLVVWLWCRPLTDFHTLFREWLWIALGFGFAILPMVMYQIAFGDILNWVYVAFMSGTNIVDFAFFHDKTYVSYIKEFVADGFNIDPILGLLVTGLYQLVLYAVPLFLAALIFYRCQKSDVNKIPPVAMIATFYGLVSFYYQIPFYLHISVPLFIFAVVCLLDTRSLRSRVFVSTTLVSTLVFAMSISAAPGVLRYLKPDNFVFSEIPKVSIWVEKENYQSVLEVFNEIEVHTSPGDSLLVFPLDPEFNFISDRLKPFPFMGTSFVVINESIFQQTVESLQTDPPELIVYNSQHVYLEKYDLQLAELLENGSLGYVEVANINDYIFYVPAKVKLSK